MKPTLFVLAAGMGSRYGGLKQLDASALMEKQSWTTRSMMPYTPDSARLCL